MSDFDETRLAYPPLLKEAEDMGLGNIRNDTGGRVYTRRDKDVLAKSYDKTATLALGDHESQTITAPSGKEWQILSLKLKAPADADATSGTHNFQVKYPTVFNMVIQGKANYNTDLLFDNNYWMTADVFKRPSTEIGGITQVGNIVIDDDLGVIVRYANNTDVGQENTRTVRLVVEERWG